MPRAHKRLKYVLILLPMLTTLGAIIVAPVFTPPHKVNTEANYVAGRCYVGSCTSDEPLLEPLIGLL